MKNPTKSEPHTEHQNSKEPITVFRFIQSLKNPPIPYNRLIIILGSVALGGFLIETHPTLNYSLMGILLWGLAIFLMLVWFPPVQGFKVFSESELHGLKGQEEWKWKRTGLFSLCLLALLGASNHFIYQGRWIALLIALGFFGVLLSVLEKHSAAFEAEPPKKAPSSTIQALWPWLLIALVGSFFLLYGRDIYAIGHNIDGYASVYLADTFLKDPTQSEARTTPYCDGWSLGNPSFAFFLMGLFFKMVGSSLTKGALFMALVVFSASFFIFGFFRFYLTKSSALMATLLFASCYWVVYFGRVTTGGNGLTLLLESALLFFFARAIEGGKARDYALFGALLSCYLMTAVQGRVFLVFSILSLAILWYFHRSEILLQKKSWALAWGVAFLWYLPMIIYYQHTANPYCFGNEVFTRDAASGGKFSIPWNNILAALQMFNVRSMDDLTEYLPRLSPWEGLAFLAGLGWSLRRLFRPAVLILLMGFMGNLAPAFMSNAPTLPWRMFSVAPFVYLLVGIGLDRIGRIVAAPLGSRGNILRILGMGLFVVFSLGWHYDVLFHQLPKNKDAYWADGGNQSGQHYTMGEISARYISGWDTYVDVNYYIYSLYMPEGGLSYPVSEVQASYANRILLNPNPFPFPLKKIPVKGAVLFLHDEVGNALKDWIHFYYPDVQPQTILNPFGDVEMRFWEITPSQIQQALGHPPALPPGGMTLNWFDSKNHSLGQLLIPTLSSKALNLEWLSNNNPAPVAWDKTAYFTAQGKLVNAEGKLLAVETAGKAEGIIDGQVFHLEGGGNLKRVEIKCSSKNGALFKIRYTPPGPGNFDLNLSEHTLAGWDMVPSSELEP